MVVAPSAPAPGDGGGTAALGLPVVLPLLVLSALAGHRLPMARALVAALYSQERLDAQAATPVVAVKTLWTRS